MKEKVKKVSRSQEEKEKKTAKKPKEKQFSEIIIKKMVICTQYISMIELISLITKLMTKIYIEQNRNTSDTCTK